MAVFQQKRVSSHQRAPRIRGFSRVERCECGDMLDAFGQCPHCDGVEPERRNHTAENTDGVKEVVRIEKC